MVATAHTNAVSWSDEKFALRGAWWMGLRSLIGLP